MSRTRFRRKENKYTQVYNNIIFKSKNVEMIGLYTIINACIDLEQNTRGTDEEFIITKRGLQSMTGYKDTKFQRVWDELKVAGYLKQYKIKTKSGKFEYEYELLEEPDLTTHHSLIQLEDGTLIPNIPSNKIVKLIEKSDKETKAFSQSKTNANTIENPHPGFTEGGLHGGFNNTIKNKVCMYVEKTEKYFDLREKDIKLISEYKTKLSIELFEELLLETINKNKSLNYLLSAIKNTVANNIKTLEEYETHKKNYIANKSKSKKTNTSTKTSTSSKNNFEYKKNKFNNFEQSFLDYEEDEFEDIVAKSQRAKYGDR